MEIESLFTPLHRGWVRYFSLVISTEAVQAPPLYRPQYSMQSHPAVAASYFRRANAHILSTRGTSHHLSRPLSYPFLRCRRRLSFSLPEDELESFLSARWMARAIASVFILTVPTDATGSTFGNNPYGSTGTLKCDACRNRRKRVQNISCRSNR